MLLLILCKTVLLCRIQSGFWPKFVALRRINALPGLIHSSVWEFRRLRHYQNQLEEALTSSIQTLRDCKTRVRTEGFLNRHPRLLFLGLKQSAWACWGLLGLLQSFGWVGMNKSFLFLKGDQAPHRQNV